MEPLIPLLTSIKPDLLQQALTHRSLRAQAVAKHETNERLEFLGDAVLELSASEFLVARFPEADEGMLTRYRSAMVRTEALSKVATDLKLHQHLKVSNTDFSSEEDHNYSDAIMADTLEAVIGALHLDKGYIVASQFINEYIFSRINEFITSEDAKDPKTLLQEIVQSHNQPAPAYSIVEESGPDHEKIFTAAVQVFDYPAVTGAGQSKQKAEQAAALVALSTYFPDTGATSSQA